MITFGLVSVAVILKLTRDINKRKNHWIPGGIQTYIMMKYVEKFYPETKFLGALKDFKIFLD